MAAIDRLPTNKNFLSPLGFNFSIFKTPGVNFFVQSASIPSLNIGRAEVNTPFNTLKYPGDKIDYGDMNITFRVDEELRNYYELYTWLTKITRNEGFTGYNSLVNANPGEGVFSDATLTILSSSKKPIALCKFKNLYPSALSELVFDTRMTDIDYIDAVATFTYQSFDLEYLI
jgi:hypothetical protein